MLTKLQLTNCKDQRSTRILKLDTLLSCWSDISQILIIDTLRRSAIKSNFKKLRSEKTGPVESSFSTAHPNRLPASYRNSFLESLSQNSSASARNRNDVKLQTSLQAITLPPDESPSLSVCLQCFYSIMHCPNKQMFAKMINHSYSPNGRKSIMEIN